MEPKHERKVAVEYWYVSENQGGKLEIRLSNLDYMRIPRNPAWSIFDLHQVVPTRFPPLPYFKRRRRNDYIWN